MASHAPVSDITFFDAFCGCGGTSDALVEMGLTNGLAVNHNPLAIATHEANFPTVRHELADLHIVHPGRYPKIFKWGVFSPECTNQSKSKGSKRKILKQPSLWDEWKENPAETRSRMTMWAVVDWSAHHNFDIVIVENVIDAKMYWPPYDEWLAAMVKYGYNYKELFLNSQFFHPTPQSRDRLYVVFWKKGNRAPDLDFRPRAYCAKCGQVEAIQSWKPGRSAGWYRQQYLYLCSKCSKQVTPYYYAAFNAIDWSLPIKKIGDRPRPLADNTLRRIRLGQERYGSTFMTVALDHTHSTSSRAWPMTEPLPTQTGAQTLAMLAPYMIRLTHTDKNNPSNPGARPRAVWEPLATQTSRQDQMLIAPQPYIVEYRRTGTASPITDPLATFTAGGKNHALVMPAPWITTYNGGSDQNHLVSDPLSTLTGHHRHALVMPQIADGLQPQTQPQTQPGVADDQAQGQGQSQNQGEQDFLPNSTSDENLADVVDPTKIRLEDMYYRMLDWTEIRRGMAFRDDYILVGNERQKVYLLGQSTTKPVIQWIAGRCLDSFR